MLLFAGNRPWTRNFKMARGDGARRRHGDGADGARRRRAETRRAETAHGGTVRRRRAERWRGRRAERWRDETQRGPRAESRRGSRAERWRGPRAERRANKGGARLVSVEATHVEVVGSCWMHTDRGVGMACRGAPAGKSSEPTTRLWLSRGTPQNYNSNQTPVFLCVFGFHSSS